MKEQIKNLKYPMGYVIILFLLPALVFLLFYIVTRELLQKYVAANLSSKNLTLTIMVIALVIYMFVGLCVGLWLESVQAINHSGLYASLILWPGLLYAIFLLPRH